MWNLSRNDHLKRAVGCLVHAQDKTKLHAGDVAKKTANRKMCEKINNVKNFLQSSGALFKCIYQNG